MEKASGYSKNNQLHGMELISVVPMKSFSMGMTGMRNLVVLLVALTVLAVVILNQMVSARISKAIAPSE